MLLYNSKQEFIGLDDESLHLLNYASLEELLTVCSDVADLFANEPGYIHNFKNFGWIDFLLHADSDASSAIVHGNGRTFSCRLSVSPFHLCAQPFDNGYRIEISQIKNISGEEFKPYVITSKTSIKELNPSTKPVIQNLQTTPLPDYTHLTATQLSEPSLFEIPHTQPTSLDNIDDIYASTMGPLSAQEPDAFLEESSDNPSQELSPAVQRPMLGSVQYSTEEKEYLSHHKVNSSYIYDPNVAADELGLPVDLIEEFIGDFIQQSYEFKDELFEAATKNDIKRLHILSHKLKGVAANLRVENAFETLNVINSSIDPIEIDTNLKYYYSIITQLEEQKVLEAQESPSVKKEESKPFIETTPNPTEDIYEFSIKENGDDSLLVPLHDIDLEDAISTDADTIVRPLHYDLKAVAGTLGMESSFMEELLNDYKADALAMSTVIIQAINAFDTHTWRSSAAKLKGISDNLRLSEISDELAILSITNDAQEAKKASSRLISYLDQL